LVTGPLGSGKTVLFTHLREALASDASVAALSGAQVGDQRSMFGMLAAALGIDHSESAELQVLSDLIRAYVQTQNEAERLCVFLVDDAHLLDEGTLEALLALSAECRVRLIFFGDPALPKLVEKAAVNLEIACHETPLLALSVSDTRAYIEWRIKQLGYTQMPFTEEQLARLYSDTDGVPGRIDELASRLLQEMASGEVLVTERSGPVFPLPHLWLALAIAAVLGFLYLLFDSPESLPTEAEVVQTDPLPVVQESAESAGSSLLRTPLPRPELDPTVADPEPAVAGLVAATEPEMEAAQQTQPAITSSEPSVAAELESLPEDDVAELATAIVEPASEPVAEDVATVAVAATEDALPPVAQGNSESAPQPIAEHVRPVTTEPKPASQVAVIPQEPSAPVEPVSLTAPLTSAIEGLNGSDWLLQQDGRYFTVQLVTLGERERMVDYLQKQSQPADFAVYARRSEGKLLYVATYGVYESRTLAEQASRRLPEAVGRLQPWIRSLNDVQQTIRAAR
ncbi:MAG: AAA family ATPase, partial [Pseudomonadales bacterium]